MKKVACLAVLAAALPVAAWADCVYPKQPTKTPDGNRAPRAEMIANRPDPGLWRDLVEYYEEVQPDLLGLHEAYDDVWFAFTEALAADLEYSPNGDTFLGGRGFRLTRPWTDVPTDPMLHFRLSTLGVLASVLSDRAKSVLGRNTALQSSIRVFLER